MYLWFVKAYWTYLSESLPKSSVIDSSVILIELLNIRLRCFRFLWTSCFHPWGFWVLYVSKSTRSVKQANVSVEFFISMDGALYASVPFNMLHMEGWNTVKDVIVFVSFIRIKFEICYNYDLELYFNEQTLFISSVTF